MTLLSLRHLASLYIRYCPSTHHPYGLICNWCRVVNQGCWSGICTVSLTDEAVWTGAAGIVGTFEADASSYLEASSEPDDPSEPAADRDGVPVSVPFSSYLEAMTTSNTTFVGVPRVILAAHVDVWVTGGTYFGSSSLSKPIISRCEGVPDF